MAFNFEGYTEEKVLSLMYPAQRKAFEEIMYGDGHVLLTAAGGYGKSFVIDAVKYFAKSRCITTATTGAAAVLVGGTTAHSTLGLPIAMPTKENLKKTTKRYKSIFKRKHPVNIVVIDEASMVGPDMFDSILQRIDRITKTSKHSRVKMVLVGDFCQMLNVVKKSDIKPLTDMYGTTNLLESNIFKESHFKIIELNENKRIGNNKEFGEYLEHLRLGNNKEEVCSYFNQFIGEPLEDSVYITPRNAQADVINNKAFQDNPNDPVYYQSEIEGEFNTNDTRLLDNLAVKVGLKVMCLVNESTEGDEDPQYINGSIGVVTDTTIDMVKVHFDNGNHIWMDMFVQDNTETYTNHKDELKERVIGKFKQIPLKICYAISINKAQGVTLDKANIDFGTGCFSTGQAYTAISRLTNPEGIRLIQPLYRSDIKVNRSVKKFYETLRGTKTKFKVIVAGGRSFDNYELLKLKLDNLLKTKDNADIVIVSGTANGADSLGEKYADENDIEIEYYNAFWDRLGRRAGYDRNVEMADNSDALIAFWNGSSRGTKHMIDISMEKGLAVRVIKY